MNNLLSQWIVSNTTGEGVLQLILFAKPQLCMPHACKAKVHKVPMPLVSSPVVNMLMYAGQQLLGISLSKGGSYTHATTVSDVVTIPAQHAAAVVTELTLMVLTQGLAHCHSCKHPARRKWPERGISLLNGP